MATRMVIALPRPRASSANRGWVPSLDRPVSEMLQWWQPSDHAGFTLEQVESIGSSLRMLPPRSSSGLDRQVALQVLDQLSRCLSAREHKILPPPPNPDRPIFVYGSLKPGEIAYEQIREHVPGTRSWPRSLARPCGFEMAYRCWKTCLTVLGRA